MEVINEHGVLGPEPPGTQHHLCLTSDGWLPHILMLTAWAARVQAYWSPMTSAQVYRRAMSYNSSFRGALLLIKCLTWADLPHCLSRLGFPAWKMVIALSTFAFLPASKTDVNLKQASPVLTELQDSVKDRPALGYYRRIVLLLLFADSSIQNQHSSGA